MKVFVSDMKLTSHSNRGRPSRFTGKTSYTNRKAAVAAAKIEIRRVTGIPDLQVSVSRSHTGTTSVLGRDAYKTIRISIYKTQLRGEL
jgi:hypothetical protein